MKRRVIQIGAILSSTFVCYAGINLTLIIFVTLLHHIILRVEVVTDDFNLFLT